MDLSVSYELIDSIRPLVVLSLVYVVIVEIRLIVLVAH